MNNLHFQCFECGDEVYFARMHWEAATPEMRDDNEVVVGQVMAEKYCMKCLQKRKAARLSLRRWNP